MELKIETLQTADEYITTLKVGVNDLIANYREGDTEQSTILLLSIIDGLRWVVEVIEHTYDILSNKVDITHIKEVLNNIINALENEDSVLVADIFEYEVLDILESIQETIIMTLGKYPEYLN